MVFLKKTSFILLVFFLISCSVAGRWWYDRLDIFISNYFFDYAEFSYEQKSYIRKITKDYLRWNTSQEIPKYITLLIEIKELNQETTSKDIKLIRNQGENLFVTSNNFFIPHIVNFCETLTDKQVEEIREFFEERITKREASLKKSKDIKLQEKNTKFFKSMSRIMGVKLNKRQLDVIRNMSVEITDKTSQSIKKQKKWDKELISILENRKDKNFSLILKRHLDNLLTSNTDEYKENIYNEIIAKTISSFDNKQSNKFKRRIEVFISSLDKILLNQKYE